MRQQHMNTAMKGTRKTRRGHIAAACVAAIAIGAVAIPQNAQAVFNYTYGDNFLPNFDNLGTGNGTVGNPNPVDMSVLNQPESTGTSDWFGTVGAGRTTTAITGNGSSDTDTFYNYGGTNSTDRSLGLQGAGFFLGVELFNTTQALTEFTLSLELEIWRRDLESDGSFRLDYRFSNTPLTGLNSGTWRTLDTLTVPAGGAGADPNVPIITMPYSTTIEDSVATPFNWAPNTYLYLRLFNTSNDDDTAIALDNLAFQAVPEPSTWVAGGLLLGFAGFTTLRRRKAAASMAAA